MKEILDNLHKNKAISILAIFLVVGLWGANFPILKMAMKDFSAYELLFSRLVVVSLVLAPFLVKINKEQLKYILLCSLFLICGHFITLYLALSLTTNVSAISLTLQLSVVFGIILSWIFFKDALGMQKIIGLTIAFVGVILLFYSPSMFDNFIPLLLGLASAFSLGLYFIAVKKLKNISSFGLIAYISLISLPVVYAMMVLSDGSISHILSISNTNSWLSFAYAALFGTILGHGIWAWLVKTQDISFITPFLLLIPLVSMVFAWFMFDEVITLDFIITGSIVVFGLFLVFIARK